MIFWKHIKGLSSKNIYSFIRFSEENEAGVNTKMISLPKIYLSNTSAFNNTNDCGHILTSHMTEGYIANEFVFNNVVHFKNSTNQFNISWDPEKNWMLSTSQNLYVIGRNLTFNGTEQTYIKSGSSIVFDNTESEDISSTITLKSKDKAVNIEKQLNVNKINLTASEIDSDVYDGSCQAVYFNATSDYRAKKDFKLLDINALELIKKVQLYSFKYKESNQPSIGIIAQDVQDININGFELVDNKEASGANFDYMSIHESKLIYILWKAIQEQQKEIEELKELIK